ncbi:acyl-CoA carboxylase subunit epsilon [Prauserella muralis]|uniref:Acetyl-CoA carboxylase biotin carboxyl carrier protein subunit n=1 Tax=Prauserella muralis TaxID=588067 RepID=A0A2V4BCD1_9PSEU|nr:acyl-CoA carboxylase subunit epsilon [Prauserella muralis]PXY32826.1 acetyl-CoA carboxylase biotin carboxyl carrier protein subunit [Prauserella muralis]TWE23966.1 acyl-CoA carboxylase epsilon subunit-like protein [Prauserella muralis]
MTDESGTDGAAGSPPLLRVLRGNPDDAELAALTAVVAGLASAERPEPPAPPIASRWADRAALLRAPLHPGPGAWRASALPR